MLESDKEKTADAIIEKYLKKSDNVDSGVCVDDGHFFCQEQSWSVHPCNCHNHDCHHHQDMCRSHFGSSKDSQRCDTCTRVVDVADVVKVVGMASSSAYDEDDMVSNKQDDWVPNIRFPDRRTRKDMFDQLQIPKEIRDYVEMF